MTPADGIRAAPAFSHVGIAVPDLDAAIPVFARLLGRAAGPVMRNAAQRVRLCQFDLGSARLELLAPDGPGGPLDGFLARNTRGGLHHLALGVLNATAFAAALDLTPLGSVAPNVFGLPILFLPPAAHAGVLIEVEGARPA